MSRRRALDLAAVVLGFVGCTVGPNYRRPDVTVPTQWGQAGQPGVTASRPDVVEWWNTFNDPVLTSLTERAVAANLDLKIAAARVREARALRGIAVADQLPTVNTSGQYARRRTSENVGLPIAEPETHFFQLGFDASWELDFWGRIRRSVEAADATVDAAQEARRDVLVILLSEVARSLVEVRGFQQRLIVTQNNVRTQADTVELTRVRFAAGLATEVDVSQARTLLATTQAQVPVLVTAREQAIHRLSVLLGQPPGTLRAELSRVEPIPTGPPAVPVGLPSDLLRRRPDVRRAERELAAATARIGVATADLFPRFSLTGTLGVAATDVAKVFVGGSRVFSIGPQVTWPLFDAGRIRADIQIQTARQEAALVGYEQAVLTSLEDVENALVAYGQEQNRQQALTEAVEASRLALDLSRELYTRGLADFLTVLDNQRALYAAEDQLVQSERTVTVNLVALYKALGGGWEVASEDTPGRASVPPAEVAPARTYP